MTKSAAVKSQSLVILFSDYKFLEEILANGAKNPPLRPISNSAIMADQAKLPNLWILCPISKGFQKHMFWTSHSVATDRVMHC